MSSDALHLKTSGAGQMPCAALGIHSLTRTSGPFNMTDNNRVEAVLRRASDRIRARRVCQGGTEGSVPEAAKAVTSGAELSLNPLLCTLQPLEDVNSQVSLANFSHLNLEVVFIVLFSFFSGAI